MSACSSAGQWVIANSSGRSIFLRRDHLPGFAHGFSFTLIIEDVIDQLKGRAICIPKRPKASAVAASALASIAPHSAAALNRISGFVFNDAHVITLSRLRVGFRQQLQNLTFSNFVSGVGHDFHDAQIANADQHLKCP